MKRVAVTALFLMLVAGGAFVSAGAGDDGGSARKYTVELDNAFGLVTGGDVKVAGVRAGKVSDLRLDRKTRHALVDFTIDKAGFGSLRKDVFCEVRPQSLIGEYFIDCKPGDSAQELPDGAVIPVEQTAGTIPGDLVNNIMRRPEKERLRIILNELGAGTGGRANDLNEVIRRLSPALRETNKVLAVLARQNRILGNLVRDGDRVIGDLAANKEGVSRWVKETRETSAASAERRVEIAESLARLPAFLRELRPTMAALGRTADAQTPTLVDLEASAGQLETLFKNLKPFTDSTRVNLRSLGQAARKGRPAVKAAVPVVKLLNSFSAKTPELANNLAITLEHLDNRDNAVEKDPRSPEGRGYTGFEALLQYVYDQLMAINVYDQNGFILKVQLFEGECAAYQNAQTLKAAGDLSKRCASAIGPNQPGINQPDFSGALPDEARRREIRKVDDNPSKPIEAKPEPKPAGGKPKPEATKPPVDLGDTVEELLEEIPPIPGLDLDRLGDELGLGGALDSDGLGQLGRRSQQVSDPRDTQTSLLDFLFGA